MRLIFMGTPELARTILQALLDSPSFEIAGVVTQPDRPKGRDLRVTASPVKQLAVQGGLPVLQPERARNPGFISQIQELQPDLIAVAAYGQILPKALLDIPPYGCLNVHTSLLPGYRGAAPIQWAILNDDAETGVTIMKMNEGMDTGDILTQQKTAITPADNAQTLHDRLAKIGADLLVRTIPRAEPRPQMLKVWEAEPTDHSGPAGQIIEAGNSGIVVACGKGALRIVSLQRENARRLSAEQFLAGHPLAPGQHLGEG